MLSLRRRNEDSKHAQYRALVMDFIQFLSTAEAEGVDEAQFRATPTGSPGTMSPEHGPLQGRDEEEAAVDDSEEDMFEGDDHPGTEEDEQASPCRRQREADPQETEDESELGSPETPPQVPRQTWASEVLEIQAMRRDNKACTAMWQVLDLQSRLNPQVTLFQLTDPACEFV